MVQRETVSLLYIRIRTLACVYVVEQLVQQLQATRGLEPPQSVANSSRGFGVRLQTESGAVPLS
jgi:hypothetical protein